jgi:hypothetical protein
MVLTNKNSVQLINPSAKIIFASEWQIRFTKLNKASYEKTQAFLSIYLRCMHLYGIIFTR